MASLDEFVTAIQSNIEALKQAQTSMDLAKQQAEEMSSQFQAMSAESMAVGAQSLKQGVEQAQSGVIPVITQLEQLITQAQGLKSLRGSGGAGPTHTRPAPNPLDAAPLALKEPIAKVGDQVTAPEPGPGSYQHELEDPDENARGLGKARRLGRGLVRRSSEIQDSVKDTAKSAASVIDDGFDPYDYGKAQATVGVSTPPPPTISGPDVKVTDVSGAVVIAAVVLIDGFARIAGRLRKRT